MEDLKTANGIVTLSKNEGKDKFNEGVTRYQYNVNVGGKQVEIWATKQHNVGDVLKMTLMPKGYTFENKDGDTITIVEDKWRVDGSYGSATNLRALIDATKLVAEFEAVTLDFGTTETTDKVIASKEEEPASAEIE